MSQVKALPRVPRDTLAIRLLIVRHEMKWSQREAAAATGVPYGTWQGMESGRETRGLDVHIAKIAQHSPYDRGWLMWGGPLSTGEDPPPHPEGEERADGGLPGTKQERLAQLAAKKRDRVGVSTRTYIPAA